MIRLHHCHQTRSMRVLWLLEELGVPFDLVARPFDGALRQPDYLGLHPAARVPVLELDGATLWESGAMIEVLCERFPDRALGRAPGDPERADWLQWVHFAETISQHTAALTQQHVMLFEDWMRSPVVTKLEAKRLGKCFGAVEARLSGRDHLLAGGFSAADIAVGQAVYMARHFAPIEPFPALTAWYGRITARDGFCAALPPAGLGIYDRDFYPPWEGDDG